MALYTLIFNFGGGTYVSQLHLAPAKTPGVEELVDTWLKALKRDTLEVAGSTLRVMEYFDSLIDCPKTFEEQVRVELDLREETMTPLEELQGVWNLNFVVELGSESSVDSVDPELAGFGELYVIRSLEA